MKYSKSWSRTLNTCLAGMEESNEGIQRVLLSKRKIKASFEEELEHSDDDSESGSESDEDALHALEFRETQRSGGRRKDETEEEEEEEVQGGEEEKEKPLDLHDAFITFDGSTVSIEAFDMKRELDEGVLDTEGNYIPTRQSNNDFNQEDYWLSECSSKAAIEDARKSKQRMEKSNKRSKPSRPLFMLDEALERMYYFVPSGKSVEDALTKCHILRKKAKKASDFKELYVQNCISNILILSNVLEQKGIENVLSLKREDIESLYKEESISGTPIDHINVKHWEFKWIESPEETHKVFSNYEMEYWKENYFDDKVAVKHHEDEDLEANWYDVSCLQFM